jgi:hypothetical protein
MMPRSLTRLACAALLLAACTLTAAEPVKSVPLKVEGDTVTVVRSFPVTVTANPGAALYVWRYPTTFKCVENMNVLTIVAAPEGMHEVKVNALYVDFDSKTTKPDAGTTSLVIGSIPGPSPTPGPTPTPTPTPVPTDLPFGGMPGLRVLLVEESEQRSKLPASQVSIIQGKRVRDYLDSKCPLSADGKQREYWMLDQNDDVSGLPQHWQDAMKRAKDKSGGKLPWVIIGNGKEAYEGELPKTVDEMLTLLKKYGEAAKSVER